ncbi:MAG: winged helix-turn-helix transcriptional regulator [Acidimicrobiaceae bacterium]|jgi:ArsR family transcriptional regulator|nr:winged helix-turn-helix transcriptional regulator [Acidimicrobiaceae bacterium]
MRRQDVNHPTPLYEVKAEFFKALGHPSRIRVLELLSSGQKSVSELLPLVGINPPHLSQQLAILKRAGLVQTQREGTSIFYSLAFPELIDVLAVARRVLIDVLAERAGLLVDLQASAPLPYPGEL